ncbi:hypothetical protein ACCS53_38470, partial [Rhizobium ruizarguesonis]
MAGSMDDVLKAVIAVDGAKVSFGAVRALDGVTLRVMPGECVGLVVHNGAGKSTIVSVKKMPRDLLRPRGSRRENYFADS